MIDERIKNIIEKTKATLLSKKQLFASNFISVFEEEYKLPNGKIISKQAVSKNSNKEAVIVITKTIDNKYLLVFQNRVDNVVSIEFPSGYIEANETITEAAKREVLEETGYLIKNIRLIDTFIPNIGTESSKIHIIYGENAEKTNNQELDDDEFINYNLFSYDELEYLIRKNYIQSGGNKLAFFHLKEIIKNNE